jgi:BirA family biotin operon repressor/biotin-[acetyl-CoA-carboxylase] ligase
MSAAHENSLANDHASMGAHHTKSNPPASIDRWSESIQSTLAGLTHFNCALVSAETSSTQDAAAACALGCVVTTGRQISGRGRLGNLWADTGDQGLAATFVVKSQTPDRLAMAAAVATASTLRAMVSHDVAARIGVKWPNDIVVARAGAAPQKIAGILIESKDDRSLIGIGINVAQSSFAPEIAQCAISLLQLGQECDRLAVLLRLIQHLDHQLSASNRVMEEDYQTLDRTAGLRLKFRTPQGVVEGVVLRCDPAIGLLVQTSQGVKTLPAATTRVEP